MTDIESRLRGTLTDERRSLDAPPDVSAWVAAGVSRQRKRMAAVATIVTVAVLALGSAVVLPIVLRDDPATYVAGAPDEETGLLAWEPVGSLVEDSAAIEAAVQAWSDDAPEARQPGGDVYVLMAGEEVGGGGGAYLQGRSADGDAMLAFLSRDADSADWNLLDTTEISDPSSTEFVVVPPRLDVEGSAVAVLAPKWRDVPARWLEKPLGWSEVLSDSRIEDTQWRLIFRSFPNDWLTALGVPLEGDTAQRVLLGKGNGVAHLVEVPTSGASKYVGVDTGTVVRSSDGGPPGPEALEPGAVLAEQLGWSTPLEIMLLARSGRTNVEIDDASLTAGSNSGAVMTQVQIETTGARPVVGALVQDNDTDAILCWSYKTVTEDAVSRTYMPFAACTLRASEGTEVTWVLGAGGNGDVSLVDPVVEIERASGSVVTEPLVISRDGSVNHLVVNDTTAPVVGYTFRAVDPFEGTLTTPWRWPAAEDIGP